MHELMRSKLLTVAMIDDGTCAHALYALYASTDGRRIGYMIQRHEHDRSRQRGMATLILILSEEGIHDSSVFVFLFLVPCPPPPRDDNSFFFF